MSEQHNVRYLGPRPHARRFVGTLESNGLCVDWTPPVERRDAQSFAENIAAEIVVTGGTGALKYAITLFRGRNRQGSVEVDGQSFETWSVDVERGATA